jgi:hypothetical protein
MPVGESQALCENRHADSTRAPRTSAAFVQSRTLKPGTVK